MMTKIYLGGPQKLRRAGMRNKKFFFIWPNIPSIDPADVMEEILQAHKQDSAPPKVGYLLAHYYQLSLA